MNPFLNDLEAFNISPSKRYIDYICILNKRTCRGEDTLPRHQVLEAAFQDHDHSPSGISAFLSPCQRAELLTRHDEGNRRIARRYGSGEILFSEPEPHASDPWIPPASLDLMHLVDLDTKVRGLKANKACWHHALATLRRQLTPRVLWIVPPSTEPEDLCLAASLFAGLAGSPDAESRLHPILPERLIRSRTIILVGLRAAESLGTEYQRRLRKRRSIILLLLGSATCAMVDRQHLERCAAVADAVVFANLDLRDSVVSDHPIWRTIRVEPLESSEHPDQEFLAHFALTQPKPTAQRHACRR